ncbi:hypothetical protein N7478_008833 [Penicillium angulare]|uniref:uncharacterized protein n=1 Tax=Penicillium angulare TaxID=116970 RepID=UPI002541C6E7|nr:uncharacterized protein N7478_008833 [Penicillium angulare]KAJ5273708.1 hypothetical protein N7478_008833 [Penicillium angulare]
MAFSPTPNNEDPVTLRTRDLVFVLITNSLCLVATLLLVLRVYTYLYIVQRKGTKALMWAIIAWALGFPCMMIYDYGVFQPNLKSPHLYRFSAVIFMCFAISFARLGILMYIFDIQRAAYQPGKHVLFGVVLLNLFNSSIFAIVALTYMFCHEAKYDPTHISCPAKTTVIELFIAVGGMSQFQHAWVYT